MEIHDPDRFRANVRSRLAEEFADCEGGTQGDVGLMVERGIFNFTISEAKNRKVMCKWENTTFVAIYIARLRSVLTNLQASAEFRQQIASGEISGDALTKMTHQEFQPEKWKDMIERKTLRDASKLVDNIQASTDMFTCRKCRGKRCTYYEMQTRSADEPATVFITCLDCGKNWRQ
jgi:transcription elongation factor S-II